MDLAELAQPTPTVWTMMDLLPKELMSYARVVSVLLRLQHVVMELSRVVKNAILEQDVIVVPVVRDLSQPVL